MPIVCDYFDYYVNYLEENNLMDYADMVIKATTLIKNIDYDYVLVDEYQDISGARFELLKKILDESAAKLIVVGDDWQSIYGFTGCEVKYFSNFSDYFDDFTEIYLDETYRASNQLINAAGKFIDADYLISKNLQSEKSLSKPIELRLYSGKDKREKELNEDLLVYEIIKELSRENYAEVMILSRYNDHLESIKEKLDDLYIDVRFDIDVSYNTFHTAKGLEAENVILLDVNHVNSGKGIPSKVTTDGFMRFVSFNNDSEKQSEEERRLFYVALTRTRNKVFLCAEDGRESPFIYELDKNAVKVKEFQPPIGFNPFYNNNKTIIKDNWEYAKLIGESDLRCPKCKTGHINLYSINELKYVACSRFEQCGSFIDEKIVDDEIINNIEKCPNCKNGFIFTNHEGDRICSNKRCKSNKNKSKKKKVKIKSGLFDDEIDEDSKSKSIELTDEEIAKRAERVKIKKEKREKEHLKKQNILNSKQKQNQNIANEEEMRINYEREKLEKEFKEKERLLELEKKKLEKEFREKERLLELKREKLRKEKDVKLTNESSKKQHLEEEKLELDRKAKENEEKTKNDYISQLRARNK